MTLEEAEIKKTLLEIKKLEQPFWKNPAYLTILASIIIGFSGYYVALDEAKEAQVKRLQKENDRLSENEQSLALTRLELKADDSERKHDDFKLKNQQIENSIIKNEIKLLGVQDKLEFTKGEFDRTKQAFGAYKKDVNRVIEEVRRYGPGFAKGLVESKEGQDEIKAILLLTDKKLIEERIELFAFGIANQAINETLKKKTAEIKL